MPKKPARKSPAKKAAPKKTVAKKAVTAKKKTVKKAVSMSTSSSANHWTKPRMHKEQMEFYDRHPNAKNLIFLFLIVTGVFILTYVMTMM